MKESLAELLSAIEEVVRRRGQVTPEELRSISTRLGAACKSTHAKLDECYRLASSGLRSEAIFLADSTPPLMQSIEVIEGSAAQELRVMLAAAEIPVPPATNMDRLGVIESAHAEFNQLKPLLSEYSRLNLAGASTRSKMQIVRRLIIADKSNQAWPTDLAALETKRFREIREAITSRSQLTEGELKEMVEDLQLPDTRTPPAPALIGRTVERYDTMRRKRFDETIGTLTPLATAAFLARNVDQLDDLLREVDYHVETDRFEVPPAQASQLADAREWLAERLRTRAHERAFRRDCDALEQMLGKPVSAAKLRALRERIAGFGLDVPNDLDSRALQTQSVSDAYERRRRAVITAMASVVVLCALAGVAMGIWYVADSSARHSAIASIDTQLAAGQLESARDLLASAHRDHPRWFSFPEFQVDESRFATMQKEEADRASMVGTRLASLDALSDPDLNTSATLALRKALHDMMRTQEEKDRLKLVEAKLDARITDRQIRADAELEQLLSKMKPLVKSMNSAIGATEIEAAIAEYDRLAGPAGKIQFTSEEETRQLTACNTFRDQSRIRASELRAAEAKANQRREEQLREQAADELTLTRARALLPDLQAYLQALRNAHAIKPKVFADVAPIKLYTDLYLSVLNVNRHAAAVAPIDRSPDLNLSSEAIKSTWGAIAKDTPLAPTTPYGDAIAELRRRLAYADDFPSKTDELRTQVLSRTFYHSANCIVVLRPDRASMLYYADEKSTPVIDNTGVTVYYFDDHNDVQHRPYPPGTRIDKIYLAPHSELMRRIENRLEIERKMRGITSQIPAMIKDVLSAETANAYARRRLLDQLVKLNEAAGNPAPFGDTQRKQLEEIDRIHVSGPFKPEEGGHRSSDLVSLEAALKQMSTSVLDREWDAQVAQRRLKSWMLLIGLYRPLRVSGCLTVDRDGTRKVQPVGDGKPLEYWVVRNSESGPVFEIIAKQEKPDSIRLLPCAKDLPDGLPLLSPADGASSTDLLKIPVGSRAPNSSIELPKCWPVNTLNMPDRKEK